MEPVFLLSDYKGNNVVVDFLDGSQEQGMFLRLRDDFYVFVQQGQEAEVLRRAWLEQQQEIASLAYDVLGYPKQANVTGNKVVRVTPVPQFAWTNTQLSPGVGVDVILRNGGWWKNVVQSLDPSGAVILKWSGTVKPGEFWAPVKLAPEPIVKKTPKDRIAELESLVHNFKAQIEKYEKNQ